MAALSPQPVAGPVDVLVRKVLSPPLFPERKSPSPPPTGNSHERWRLYTKAKDALPEGRRMENLMWRLMALDLNKKSGLDSEPGSETEGSASPVPVAEVRKKVEAGNDELKSKRDSGVFQTSPGGSPTSTDTATTMTSVDLGVNLIPTSAPPPPTPTLTNPALADLQLFDVNRKDPMDTILASIGGIWERRTSGLFRDETDAFGMGTVGSVTPSPVSPLNLWGMDGITHASSIPSPTLSPSLLAKPIPVLPEKPATSPRRPSGPSATTRRPSGTKPTTDPTSRKSDSPRTSSQNLICSNCNTSTTPLWRRDTLGNPLCNACGLFLKLHGTHRPAELRTDVIKKRVRAAGKGGKGSVSLPGSPSGGRRGSKARGGGGGGYLGVDEALALGMNRKRPSDTDLQALAQECVKRDFRTMSPSSRTRFLAGDGLGGHGSYMSALYPPMNNMPGALKTMQRSQTFNGQLEFGQGYPNVFTSSPLRQDAPKLDILDMRMKPTVQRGTGMEGMKASPTAVTQEQAKAALEKLQLQAPLGGQGLKSLVGMGLQFDAAAATALEAGNK